jgi:hypothetical protein
LALNRVVGGKAGFCRKARPQENALRGGYDRPARCVSPCNTSPNTSNYGSLPP